MLSTTTFLLILVYNATYRMMLSINGYHYNFIKNHYGEVESFGIVHVYVVSMVVNIYMYMYQ